MATGTVGMWTDDVEYTTSSTYTVRSTSDASPLVYQPYLTDNTPWYTYDHQQYGQQIQLDPSLLQAQGNAAGLTWNSLQGVLNDLTKSVKPVEEGAVKPITNFSEWLLKKYNK